MSLPGQGTPKLAVAVAALFQLKTVKAVDLAAVAAVVMTAAVAATEALPLSGQFSGRAIRKTLSIQETLFSGQLTTTTQMLPLLALALAAVETLLERLVKMDQAAVVAVRLEDAMGAGTALAEDMGLA